MRQRSVQIGDLHILVHRVGDVACPHGLDCSPVDANIALEPGARDNLTQSVHIGLDWKG